MRKLGPTGGIQIELFSWRAPEPTREMLVRRLLDDAASLVRRLDAAVAGAQKIAAFVASLRAPVQPAAEPAPTPAPDLEGGYPDSRPVRYSECLALGLGTDKPCPFYTCRAHLGLYVRDDGSIRTLIDPDQIDSAGQHTCVHAAASREWAPVDIAKQLHISLGLEELIQRHGVAKTGDVLGKFRDERRRCEMDIDGVPDCRP